MRGTVVTGIADSARGAAHFAPTILDSDRVEGAAAFTPDTGADGWRAAVDDLLATRLLADDYDGQGSPAPDPALVDGAITLAQTLSRRGVPPPARTHPGVNGTIYFEWYTPAGYVEVEVLSPTAAEHRFLPPGAPRAAVTTLRR